MLRPSLLDAWLARKCASPDQNLAEAVRGEQLTRLRAQIEYVREHSTFYREHLQAGARKNFSWLDLPKLPFTEASDLRKWKKFLCVSQGDVERLVTIQSSGTSGTPKSLAFGREDLEATKDFFKIGMAQLVQKGNRALVLWPGAQRPYGVSALLREALGEAGVTAYAGNPAASLACLRLEIEKYNPHVIIAAPRQLASLAALLADWRPAGIRHLALRGILSSAESLPKELADVLGSRYGLLVLDHYGLTETGYGGGVECPAHDGYHLRELDIFMEIVHIESGLPLPDGQEGEIVITTLARVAMPLIRYRTGDVAAMLPGPCQCGSPMRRLSPIRGRIVRKTAATSPNSNNFMNPSYSIEQIEKGDLCERTVHPSL